LIIGGEDEKGKNGEEWRDKRKRKSEENAGNLLHGKEIRLTHGQMNDKIYHLAADDPGAVMRCTI